MKVTGKTIRVAYEGRALRLYNQRSALWTARYDFENGGETLHNAGCGLFSIANAVWYMHGQAVDVDALAAFAMENGARDNTGTDRPTLLRAMCEKGLAKRYGFTYRMDGLRNDKEVLPGHLKAGDTALCNLRVGHIVALIGVREVNGETEVLAADPYAESDDPRIRDSVRECIEGSEIVTETLNENGARVGFQTHYALYYAPLSIVRDFNLLYRTDAG